MIESVGPLKAATLICITHLLQRATTVPKEVHIHVRRLFYIHTVLESSEIFYELSRLLKKRVPISLLEFYLFLCISIK